MCLLYSMCIEQVDQYYKQHIQSGRREPPFFINYMVSPLLSLSPVTLGRVEGRSFLPALWEGSLTIFLEVEHSCDFFLLEATMYPMARQFKMDYIKSTRVLSCADNPSSILISCRLPLLTAARPPLSSQSS